MNVMMCDANMLWVSGVEPVACPEFSTGADVGSGCSCDVGLSGVVVATSVSPYYESSCAGANNTVSCVAYLIDDGCI
jgi:hypothetical protein